MLLYFIYVLIFNLSFNYHCGHGDRGDGHRLHYLHHRYHCCYDFTIIVIIRPITL